MPEEDVYRQFKEDPEGRASQRVRRARAAALPRADLSRLYDSYREFKTVDPIPEHPRAVVRIRRRRGLSASRSEEYVAWKANLTEAVDDLKSEIREQHKQTRKEVQHSRTDILAAIKSSPSEYVKLASEFGSVILLFALAVRFTLKIELVNTAFALFMLFSLGFYWLMAQAKQFFEKRDANRQEPCR